MAFTALSVLLVALGVAHASEDCTDIDFFLSIDVQRPGQEVSCAMQKSAGQCGCYVYAGENGTSNWVNPSTVRVPQSAAENGAGPATRRARRTARTRARSCPVLMRTKTMIARACVCVHSGRLD